MRHGKLLQKRAEVKSPAVFMLVLLMIPYKFVSLCLMLKFVLSVPVNLPTHGVKKWALFPVWIPW